MTAGSRHASSSTSAIPVGSQLSPQLFDLANFLRATVAHSGDKAAQLVAIWQPSVRIKPKPRPPSRRTASLPLEAAVQYELLEPSTYLATRLAVKLSRLRGPLLYEEFARHILLNLGGLRVIEGTAQMRADDEPITGDSLAVHLTNQGFRVTEHNTAINSLRMWLAKAGLFPEKGRGSDTWKVDDARLEQILKLSPEQIGILASEGPKVHAFVLALCREEPKGWVLASRIRDAAEAKGHIRFGRSSLPNEVLRPLQRAGLIEFETGGTTGGKSSRLKTTAKFHRDILEPFVTRTVKTLNTALSDYYARRPEEIFEELKSKDTHVKGRALEAFAIMIMRKLGLEFVCWNRRAADTAQAEVDVILSGFIGAVHTRWQVQCKNTPNATVRLRDVASEVGLLPVTQATHILMFANAKFSSEAIKYANAIMRRTAVSISLLDKHDFETLRLDPTSLMTILLQKAKEIGALQRPTTPFGKD